MMLAAQYDRVKVVKLLLLKGADLSIIDMVSCEFFLLLVGRNHVFIKVLTFRTFSPP